MSPIVKKPASSPFLVFYVDTLSAGRSRQLVQTALKAFADLQGIGCVCIDRITLPEELAEASAQLGAYSTADLVWFHFSESSEMTQKAFEKAIGALFRDVQLGSPVWVNLLPVRFRELYQDPWG